MARFTVGASRDQTTFAGRLEDREVEDSLARVVDCSS